MRSRVAQACAPGILIAPARSKEAPMTYTGIRQRVLA
jgi:hypothetical protein